MGRITPRAFLAALDTSLVNDLDYPMFTDTYTAERPVGQITAEWAERLGLPTTVILSGGAFDCHMGRWEPVLNLIPWSKSLARPPAIS